MFKHQRLKPKELSVIETISDVLRPELLNGSMTGFNAIAKAVALLEAGAAAGWDESNLVDAWEEIAAAAWQQAAAHHAAPAAVDLYHVLDIASEARRESWKGL